MIEKLLKELGFNWIISVIHIERRNKVNSLNNFKIHQHELNFKNVSTILIGDPSTASLILFYDVSSREISDGIHVGIG